MKPVTTNKALLLKYSADKEVNIYMPSIKPISDLKNYIDDLKEVDIFRRVYLTINGHAEYGILTMEEIDEFGNENKTIGEKAERSGICVKADK